MACVILGHLNYSHPSSEKNLFGICDTLESILSRETIKKKNRAFSKKMQTQASNLDSELMMIAVHTVWLQWQSFYRAQASEMPPQEASLPALLLFYNPTLAHCHHCSFSLPYFLLLLVGIKGRVCVCSAFCSIPKNLE